MTAVFCAVLILLATPVKQARAPRYLAGEEELVRPRRQISKFKRNVCITALIPAPTAFTAIVSTTPTQLEMYQGFTGNNTIFASMHDKLEVIGRQPHPESGMSVSSSGAFLSGPVTAACPCLPA